MDLDQYLVALGRRLRQVDELKYLRPPVCSVDNSFHRLNPLTISHTARTISCTPMGAFSAEFRGREAEILGEAGIDGRHQIQHNPDKTPSRQPTGNESPFVHHAVVHQGAQLERNLAHEAMNPVAHAEQQGPRSLKGGWIGGSCAGLLAQGQKNQQADSAHENEHALNDPAARGSEGQTLVVPSQHRVERHGDTGARDGPDELEDGSDDHPVVMCGQLGEIVWSIEERVGGEQRSVCSPPSRR